MGRLAQTEGLTEFEQDILATVRDFTPTGRSSRWRPNSSTGTSTRPRSLRG
jgi:hypothetical protein